MYSLGTPSEHSLVCGKECKLWKLQEQFISGMKTLETVKVKLYILQVRKPFFQQVDQWMQWNTGRESTILPIKWFSQGRHSLHDAVASAEAEAEAVPLARSDKAFPIKNNRLCSRRHLSRPREDVMALPRQPDASTRYHRRLYLLRNYLGGWRTIKKVRLNYEL